MMIVMDAKGMLLISGNGEIIEPDDGIVAIGSGGSFAMSAARALTRHATDMEAKEVAKASLEIAAEICVYTNHNIIVEEI